jgi:DNA modification methylase
VYDPFMGSGTTAVACVNMDLHFVGSEISENQVRYATERIHKAQMRKEQEKAQFTIFDYVKG